MERPTLLPEPPGRWRRAPGLWVLAHYPRGALRGDLLAGLTVAAYLVPQVMAYAEVVGLSPVAGLWAVLGPLLAYALLGSSRLLSIGPESTTTLMTAAGVAALGAGDGPRTAAAAGVLALAMGLLCLLGGLGRLGFLANLLSRPVLIGYLTGIALAMMISQLEHVTGVPVSGSSSVAELVSFAAGLSRVHLPTVVLAAAVLAAVVAVQRWRRQAPGPLLALVLAALAVVVGHLDRYGIAITGDVPRGLPSLVVPSAAGLNPVTVVPAAVGLAVVAYSDNTLTGRAFASRRNETLDGSQELVALGVANLASGLSQGFPVSSSGSRTAIAAAAGARTQLHSLVTLGLVVLVLLVLAPALSAIPTAGLGAMVIFAAAKLIDLDDFRRLRRFRTSELLIALATVAAVLSLGVLWAIGLAIALSLADLLRRIGAPHDAVLGLVPGLAGMHDVGDYARAEQVPGLVVYRFDAPLFFANAEHFRERVLDVVTAAQPPARWVVLDVEAISEIDLTSADALESLRRALEERGVVLAMARVKTELRSALDSTGFTSRLGAERMFPTLPTAVDGYRRWQESADSTEPSPG